MTDYDRGAYTPQTDAPLAFDPRRPSERRPMPMALIGSAAVLVILLAGVAMVYRGGVRHAGESPRPVGEPVMAVKTAPNATQTASTGAPANLDVYSDGQANTTGAANQTGASPAFAPSAEQPAARPAPSSATVAMLSRPAAPTHIERPATPTETAAAPAETPARSKSATPASPSSSEAKPVRAAKTTTPAHAVLRGKLDESELAAAGATRTVADADTPAASEATPAPTPHKTRPAAVAASTTAQSSAAQSSAAPAVAAKATAAPGKSVVQIGAFSSSTLADKGYADVSATLPDRMSGKAKHVQPLDKDGTTLYRTWLSGFATRADAQAFCEALKAKGKTCLVKG